MQSEEDFLDAAINQIRKWRKIIDILRPPVYLSKEGSANPLRHVLDRAKEIAQKHGYPEVESLVDKVLAPEEETAITREILAILHESKARLLAGGIYLEDPTILRIEALISKIE